jgi:hypothetical protein
MSRIDAPQGIPAREPCPSYPDGGDFNEHEPLKAEIRCAYCGKRLAPEKCSGCGKFMTAEEMHNAYMDGIWRCAGCA